MNFGIMALKRRYAGETLLPMFANVWHVVSYVTRVQDDGALSVRQYSDVPKTLGDARKSARYSV